MEVRDPYLQAARDLRKNPGQWKAYESKGHCVILAGPGSGKTKTLTIKLARVLAEDVRPPRGVGCITYSTQCARELRKRLSALGVADSKRISIGTVHSFCLQHIIVPFMHLTPLPKKQPIRIALSEEASRLQQVALDKAGINDKWGLRFEKYRRTYLDRDSPDWKAHDDQAATAIEIYEGLLDDAGLIDFDGMVLIGLFLVERYPWVRKALASKFPVLVVDEYQDLGYALDRIVRALCFGAGIRLIAVGDPDQCIYGFSGAQPSLLKKLAESPEVASVWLNRNYRCGRTIIQASEIALGETRGFESGLDEYGSIFFHELPLGIVDQARHIRESIIPLALARRPGRQLGDIGVLYLDRNDGNIIANAIRETTWGYIRVDGNNPYQSSPVTYWLEDCAAWCAGGWTKGNPKLSSLLQRWANFNESLSSAYELRKSKASLVRFLCRNRFPDLPLHSWLRRFLDNELSVTLAREPRLRDDRQKVENLLKVSSPGEPLEGYTVAFFGGQGGSPHHLNLTTLHSAKGLEYDVVVMMGLEQGRIPYYTDSGLTLGEKRRLFYVGLTRARHEVHLVYSGWYAISGGRRFSRGRSIFVDDVERETASGS